MTLPEQRNDVTGALVVVIHVLYNKRMYDDVLKITSRRYINLVHLLEDFVDKAERYMENNTHNFLMFLKLNIMSSGNVTFQ